jgi:hypothetical protein
MDLIICLEVGLLKLDLVELVALVLKEIYSLRGLIASFSSLNNNSFTAASCVQSFL